MSKPMPMVTHRSHTWHMDQGTWRDITIEKTDDGTYHLKIDMVTVDGQVAHTTVHMSAVAFSMLASAADYFDGHFPKCALKEPEHYVE